VKGSNVLPALLHKGDQEVDGHGDVLPETFFGNLDGANSSAHAVNFLALEFDGLLEFVNLADDLLSFSQVHGEFAHLDQDVAQKFGDLLSD